MQSIKYLPASSGVGNPSLMTVQTLRAANATTIITNTVSGVPAFFYATMGTPHTFTDPVTGDTITIISEATAVDFAGHTNSGQLVIDAIAPGYTDAGSKVGDIIVLRPLTEWSNNLFNILSQSHNDDGSIKTTAITYQPTVFDHVASGAILAGLAYSSTLTASLSAGVCYINGLMQTIAALATRTYTASKDTYVDALYNASGIVTIVYTEVANNAASPALAANSIRLGIVVTGAANILNVGSINQGEETKILPIASSIAYSVTDSLGNLICPRDPQRRILGMRQITTATTTTSSTTDVQVTGLSVPVIVPVGRKIRITVFARNVYALTGPAQLWLDIWDGVVSSGTQLESAVIYTNSALQPSPLSVSVPTTPTTTNKTYNAGFHTGTGANSMNLEAGATYPAYILVELE